MKNILLILSFILISGCQKDKTGIITPTNNAIDSLTINVFGLINNDSVFAIESSIKIDGVDGYAIGMTTYGTGQYYLQNIVSGKHTIQIDHPLFYSIDSTIIITSKILNITLIPKAADFLPLKVGNNWTYQFKTNSYDHGVPPKRRTSGVISVTVDSVASSPGPIYIFKYWYIKQVEIDTLYYVDNTSVPPDSLRYTNAERHYYIIEDYRHDTRSSISNNVYSAFIFFDNLYYYPRYRIPDNFGNIEAHDNYKYTKNIGFIESHVTYSDPNYGTYYERQYCLISSNLK